MNCKQKNDLKIFSYTRVCCVVFSLIITVQAFTQNELMEKMIDSINRSLLLKEYDKAFTNSLFVLRNYKDQELPIDIEDTCKRAVSSWLSYLETEKKWEEIIDIEQKLIDAPESIKVLYKSPIDKAIVKLKKMPAASSNRIQPNSVEVKPPKNENKPNKNSVETIQKSSAGTVLTAADKIQILEEQRKVFKEFLYKMKMMEKEQEKIRYSERELYEKKRLEIELARNEADKELREYVREIIEENRKNTNKIIIMVLIAASIFCVCLTVIIITVVLVNKK
ncbi:MULTISPECIES: hypothetical protein [unclassified Treponema]|uniref:hypothetical protein n=1 Tax=unclassified Treponema TaxID=2638727 RepID=UPI0020A3CE93|nr:MULTISPECIES: hypothetical protein [unclassified Treponema]UTC67671.1 hypothetical protein E4O06_03080 [Treponema sp. OMZ 789]UTC70399.1 hypothetical protein E4O01_03070 [Treponema sp. OMZ 790]UTC73113.1 hypothetical protein E4O02_03070 [Treponema sp. OMZ 791]